MEMKDIRGYKIDFGARVMVVNHKFAKAASQWSSPEYNLMKTILSEFPDTFAYVSNVNRTLGNFKRISR